MAVPYYEYDSIGNLTYSMTAGADYKWSGTQLTEINSHSGTLQPTFQYEYDCNGNRLRKTRIPASSLDSRQVTEYLLDGDKILREYTYTGSLFSSFSASAADCITYYYDESGDVIGLNYYGTDYYYYKNIFGDVLGIMPPSGTMVVRYSYDAWGNILSITGSLANSLGKDNPFRYRSYYYDNETGWYYLQSRYYDPSICRFISPDDRMLTGEGADELNLYAYCKNNPVNLSDPDGHWGEQILWAIAEAAGTATPAGLITLAGIAIAAALIYEPEQMTIAVPLPIPRAKEKIKELAPKIVIPKTKAIEKAREKERNQAYFPVDPNDFHPRGLIKRSFPGSNNGRIIKWMHPVLNVPIFEWNEDFLYGPHYHAMLPEWSGDHKKTHYKAGKPVPEPWNSQYFGG